MEKKRSANWDLMEELTVGKEMAQQLVSNPGASPDFLLAQILSCYDKAISILNNNGNSKKRKTVSKQVTVVCSAAATLDGFSWRKYGQKLILGALHPRAYYRCTHRDSQGCLATKQVQKSDHDPTVFEVSHRGRHTCVHSTREQDSHVNDHMNFGAGLKVETQYLDDTIEDDILSSFSFPCDPVGLDDIFAPMGGYSPAFVSPATSGGSNYTVSAGTSDANSPVGNFDFPLDNVEFFSFHFQSPQL